VVDASGSMTWTDPNELRFEAIGKFVALLAERGNTIGTVVFSDEIILKRPMTNADSLAAKREIVEEISSIKAGGYTNIGGALYSAIDLLGDSADPDLDSIILFMSDGNTEMPTSEEQALSLSQKADAIELARKSGYVIHTVSLNADGTAHPHELSQIANATGGLFAEVITARDLENVYNMFYQVIFNSLDYKDNLEQFPPSGVIEGVFRIPAIGVEEINLILSGLAEDYTLTDPSGRAHTKASLQSSTYSSDTFNVIKLADPIPGEWSYSIKGVAGDQIRIELIFNTNLEAVLSISPEKDEHSLNDTVTFTVTLTQNGEVADPALYDGFEAEIDVGCRAYAYSKKIRLNPEVGFTYELTLDTQSHYSVYGFVSNGDFRRNTNRIEFNVDNTPPIFNRDIHHTVYLRPFFDNTSRIDLSPAATDPLGRRLGYSWMSTSYNMPCTWGGDENEFYIDGSELVMRSYSLNRGSITMRAIDPLGGYAEFNVYITTVSVAMWSSIFLLSGGLTVLVILAIIAWLNLNKRFYGICYVRYFNHESDEYYEEIEIANPKRGKRRLPVRKLKNTGFNLNKCHFQASGKRHIFLKTKALVYGHGVNDKKFKINGDGFEVQISKNADSIKGIIVRFETHKGK
jgi:hypothetical protein